MDRAKPCTARQRSCVQSGRLLAATPGCHCRCPRSLETDVDNLSPDGKILHEPRCTACLLHACFISDARGHAMTAPVIALVSNVHLLAAVELLTQFQAGVET
ncbi:hypothetical protein ABBQ38_010238 [Trebouxia sp. C0009 RCD-2024]